MKRSFLRRTNLMLFVAFLLGGVAGGFGVHAYELHRFADALGGSPRRARVEFRIRAMSAELDLSRQQEDAIRKIYAAHEGEVGAAIHQCAPEIRALKDGINAEVREVLDSEQRAKHDAMMKRK